MNIDVILPLAAADGERFLENQPCHFGQATLQAALWPTERLESSVRDPGALESRAD
jgi:hypothetical protein